MCDVHPLSDTKEGRAPWVLGNSGAEESCSLGHSGKNPANGLSNFIHYTQLSTSADTCCWCDDHFGCHNTSWMLFLAVTSCCHFLLSLLAVISCCLLQCPYDSCNDTWMLLLLECWFYHVECIPDVVLTDVHKLKTIPTLHLINSSFPIKPHQ